MHVAQVEIESVFLLTSFSVLEDQTMDMLLGLDMLKRHQCTIDLQRNVLRIGTTGTETNFLPENELPTHSRLTLSDAESEKITADEMKALEAAEIQKAIERSKQEHGWCAINTVLNSKIHKFFTLLRCYIIIVRSGPVISY